MPIRLDAAVAGEYLVDFYAARPSASGGFDYLPLSSMTLTSPAAGSTLKSKAVLANVPGPWRTGDVVHAIVTDPSGNSSEMAPLGAPLSSVGLPPRVEDVLFLRSNGGAPLSMEAQVATRKQLNSLNLVGVDQIRIEFDRPIDNFQVDDLKLRALVGGSNFTQVAAIDVDVEPDGLAATWTLSAPLPRNVFALRLEDRLASGGAALNGEWINANTYNQPSDLPTLLSGDSAAGGDFVFAFVNFPSDFNGDYHIDLLDLDVLGAGWGTGNTHSTGDANGDGVVDLLDLDILGANFGTSLGFNTLRNLLSAANYTGGTSGDLVDADDESEFDDLFANQDELADLNGDNLFNDVDQVIFEWYRDLEVV